MRSLNFITLAMTMVTASALPGPVQPSGGLADRFKQIDCNGDGKLTRDEIPRLFDQIDANKDGVVTPEEARAYRSGAPVSPAPPPSTPAPSADAMKSLLDVRYANTPGVDAKAQSLDIYTPKSGKNAPANPAPAPSAAPAEARAPQGFQFSGERWTYRDGEFAMNGILLKPSGKGPFPAVLISHGLGGSAESFGLSKAREMVKWGLVCIAPDYTHSAKFMSGQRPGGGKGATKGGAAKDATKAGAGGPRANSQYATYGASEENLRRARTCIELLAKTTEVDAKRIAGYGHSMGGFVTIGLAASAPDLLKTAAISGSGVAPEEGFPAPSAAKAENVRTPFLILHGSVDPVVRPQQSADFKAILDKNHVPNLRTVYEGEGHPIDQSKREEVCAAIRDWFGKQAVLIP